LAARHFSGGDAEGDSIAMTGTFKLGVIGSAYADTIRASNTVTSGLDADNLVSGGGGDDRLIAGRVRDALVGGSGADVFVYESTSDIGYFDDRITDFSSAQGDKIDLRGIGGELSWYISGSAMIVRIYDSGYHHIQLDNVNQLSLTDFIL
jgi:Ca2+-binding RTX toxin-like protein